jgi:hypothetical protein
MTDTVLLALIAAAPAILYAVLKIVVAMRAPSPKASVGMPA